VLVSSWLLSASSTCVLGAMTPPPPALPPLPLPLLLLLLLLRSSPLLARDRRVNFPTQSSTARELRTSNDDCIQSACEKIHDHGQGKTKSNVRFFYNILT
jgi:hypothetical protein